MRVAINARTLATDHLRGWSRYTLNLIRELSRLDVSLVLLTDRPLNRRWLDGACVDKVKVVEKPGKFYLHWEQCVLPRLCEQEAVDILHCPVHFGLPLKGKFKKVITLHDAIEVAYYDKQMTWLEKLSPGRNYVRALNVLSRRVSDHVLTVSEFSKQDLIKNYKLLAKKIRVTHPAADAQFRLDNILEWQILSNKYALPEKYFFYIGGLEGRKNIDFLLQCFEEMSDDICHLVIGGGKVEEIQAFKQQFSSLNKKGRCQFLGFVPDEDLPSLYYYARSFIYPSLYEGFGLQAVEAMQMNCPVIASNSTSLAEVVGNRQALFNPTHSGELIQLIKKVKNDDKLHLALKEKAMERAKDFSWHKMARQTLDLYKDLLKVSANF